MGDSGRTREGRQNGDEHSQSRAPTVPSISSSSHSSGRGSAAGEFDSDTPAVTPLLAGGSPPSSGAQMAGRYRVVRKIGEGGMGQVFEVVHTTLGRTFALKTLHQQQARDPKARRAFFREARYAASLQHRNVVTVVDFGDDPDFGPFMVMEFLQGESLSVVLRRRKRLDVRRACDVTQQVADTLDYVHDHGILHCDIKTRNILLVAEQVQGRTRKVVKILDFGLARRIGLEEGGVGGTAAYMAPEVAAGGAPSPQSDVYGVGVLLFQLLTGTVPWKGSNSEVLSARILSDAPSLAEKSGVEFDEALETLVARALARDPKHRHKDMASFLYELQTTMSMLGMERRRRGPGRPHDEHTRRLERRRELARTVYDDLRLPVALVDRAGAIVLANASFGRFLFGGGTSAEGENLLETRLASLWDGLQAALEAAASGAPTTKMLSIDARDGDVHQIHVWVEASAVAGLILVGAFPVKAGRRATD